MPRPTLTQLKWFALFFGAFFTLTSVAQYAFIRYTAHAAVRADLQTQADNLARATDFRGAVDPTRYFKAYAEDAADYVTVLRDGSILDVDLGSGRPLSEVLPPVQRPGYLDRSLAGPVTIDYETETIRPETWMIQARQVEGGYVVVGFSALDEVVSPEKKLAHDLAAFGKSIDDAVHVNQNKLDNALNSAVLTDTWKLIDADGRLPLKTDPMLVAQLPPEEEISGDDATFLVGRFPLKATEGATPVGTIVQFKDVTLQTAALRHEVIFNVAIAVASFGVFLSLAGYYAAKHEGEKRAIRAAFQHYFSPQIMEAILREPDRLKLGGQRREVTILFSDIRSFTSLTERLPPQQLTRLLQEYFDAMTEEVFATEGIVDKYVGDAIMAFWGAPIEQPDQADRAVRTAMNMVRRLSELREKWQADGIISGPFEAGIGINLGIATVGNFGSAKRFDYTLIGDAVNAASRIEQLNKEYQSHIIISETTRAQLTMKVPTHDLGEVQVRGKETPIRVYAVTVDA